eukprot:scaffold1789_cov375-Prasinococcus_capsulatus_cf.AAC.19
MRAVRRSRGPSPWCRQSPARPSRPAASPGSASCVPLLAHCRKRRSRPHTLLPPRVTAGALPIYARRWTCLRRPRRARARDDAGRAARGVARPAFRRLRRGPAQA